MLVEDRKQMPSLLQNSVSLHSDDQLDFSPHEKDRRNFSITGVS